ncbi:proline-rich protein HaeIII subfamily 1-like [Iris pallida]|uniref:Proline-rich protein HaeIII subfamily 1-like n=1 Tax=Iris pallida TaxID=29817 RepID=A0AAX6GWA8_IRIPA|nr:proline-rich protein HaeIII subfamily 1-like [Iris pallida]
MFRRDAREMKFILAPRRSNFARIFPEIRPLDQRFLRSVAISFRGANFVSLYPPPQLCLACYQFWCEAGLCGFSGTLLCLSAVQVIEANSLEVPASLEGHSRVCLGSYFFCLELYLPCGCIFEF